MNTSQPYPEDESHGTVLPQEETVMPETAPPPCRKLIHIPIVHTEADMGGLKKAVQEAGIRKMGAQAWQQKVSLADEMWHVIEKHIDHMNLDYPSVRLYQDGLPICGREQEIVAELAAAGSHNHQILQRLVSRGATLMGTEAPELLIEEYTLMKQVLAGSTPAQMVATRRHQTTVGKLLLDKRDKFIARRISDTLLPGETGLLFLGLLHSINARLAPDIKVRNHRC